MSLDDIWDEPIVSPPRPPPADGSSSPIKRPRQSLFLSDSDSDYERPQKRATPAPPAARPDVDALFEDLDKDKEDEDLRYKPLAPALDLAKLAKEAEARHRQTAKQATPLEAAADSLKTSTADGTKKEQFGKDEGKDGLSDGEKKGRRVLPKLDEERLVGPEGFPLLIEDIKGFIPKGKGNEHTDLNRLLQVYQFWMHKMFPKMSFKDTVNRVEKLCHSKRMQVRLSVWRDEFNDTTKDKKSADDPDIVDLTEPTLVGTEDDEVDKEPESLQLKSDEASERTPSLPPASSEADDDDFDIDAVIRAEEERLAALRTTRADCGSRRASLSPTLSDKAPSRRGPDSNAMDIDEASLWDAFDESQTLLDLPQSTHPPSTPARDEEDIWNIVDEMEQGEVPVSGVNAIPLLDNTSSGNTSRATNDEGWDEMYS